MPNYQFPSILHLRLTSFFSYHHWIQILQCFLYFGKTLFVIRIKRLVFYILNVIWNFSTYPAIIIFCFLFYYTIFSHFIFLICFCNTKLNFFKYRAPIPYLFNHTWNNYSLKLCNGKCIIPTISLKPSFNSIIFKSQFKNASSSIISTLLRITIFFYFTTTKSKGCNYPHIFSNYRIYITLITF